MKPPCPESGEFLEDIEAGYVKQNIVALKMKNKESIVIAVLSKISFYRWRWTIWSNPSNFAKEFCNQSVFIVMQNCMSACRCWRFPDGS